MTSPPEYPQDTALAEPENSEPTYPLCFRGPGRNPQARNGGTSPMSDPDPDQTAATYQPWLPDGSPEPYLTYSPAAAANHLEDLAADPDAEQDWEHEWDSEDSARYQDQIEAEELAAAINGYQGPSPDPEAQ